MKPNEVNEISYYLDQIDKVTAYVWGFRDRFGIDNYPEIRRIAKSLRMKQKYILQICEDSDKLCVHTVRAAHGADNRIGDYRVEVFIG